MQESSEEPDYDQVGGGKVAAPVPPSHQASPGWEVGEETVKRRAKRERNHRPGGPGCCDTNHQHHQARRSKSRSKSRSPGREIDRAIVIVHHHTTCSHSRLERTASPDNLSESSISFHENEVNFDLSPGSVSRPLPPENIVPEPPGLWYERSPGDVKKCDAVSCPAGGQKYSNWESCRESWFSSGSSEVRPSSGSDCPPPVRPAESTTAPATPHCRRSQESSNSSTLPRSAVRPQSSRDSGSSSSRPNSRPNTRPNTR